jgi:hypothetical protein
MNEKLKPHERVFEKFCYELYSLKKRQQKRFFEEFTGELLHMIKCREEYEARRVDDE